MSSLLQSMASFVGRAPLPLECPADPELGAWFLTPEQHVVELLLANLSFLCVAYFTYQLYTSTPHHSLARQPKKTPPTSQAQQRLAQSPPSPTLWSYAQVFLLAFSYTLLLIHKWREDRLWFLLQPCHVLHLLLLYTTTLPPTSTRAIFLFNLYLHLLFSPFLGLVAADLSCYTQPLELFNWGLQHVLLLLLPLVALLPPASFPLMTGVPFFLLSFSIEVLFHSAILTPAALATGYNLNYVLCSPAGILASFGRWYRLVMTGMCALLSLLVRYGLVEGWRWVIEKGWGGGELGGPDVVHMELQDQGQGQGKRLVMNEEQPAEAQVEPLHHTADDSKEGTRRRRSKKA